MVSACASFGDAADPDAPPNPSIDAAEAEPPGDVDASPDAVGAGDAGGEGGSAAPCTCGGAAAFCSGFEETNLSTCWTQVSRGDAIARVPAANGGAVARIAAPFRDVAGRPVSVARSLPAFSRLVCSFSIDLARDTFDELLRIAELRLRDGRGRENAALFFVSDDAVEAGVYAGADQSYRSSFSPVSPSRGPKTVTLEVTLGAAPQVRASRGDGAFTATFALTGPLALDPESVTAELVLGALPTSTPDGGDNGDFELRFDDVRCDVVR